MSDAMLTEGQLADLVRLMRRRYDNWVDFSHPQFAADEITYKQKAVSQAEELLNQPALDQLIAAGNFDDFLNRLNQVAQATNLLWRRVPSQGDTAVLLHSRLDPPTFCTHMRNLLYGDLPTPNRLQHFSNFLASQGLPNKWPFPTYFLFLCHPQEEFFVRPTPARWFLQFVGAEETAVGLPPSGDLYALIRGHAQALRNVLASRGARDMIDVQSFIWVCHRESRARTGQLNTKGQVELDVPPTEPEAPLYAQTEYAAAVHDSGRSNYAAVTPAPRYPLDEVADETGYREQTLLAWLGGLARKGQAILYGPPGTGKTFMARRLARHLVGGSNGFWELVQFHPAYAYEDFMQGIRPLTRDGDLHYTMVDGRFKQFCAAASTRSGICVLIIDEINRANIAAVFGELMYLLEYRDAVVPLAGGGDFLIPPNVRIIGTMNTADRSLALVDHALRRRFAFIRLAPNAEVLRHYHAATGFPIERLITLLHRLNDQIGDPHYHVGHSFFLHPNLNEQLPDIWRMEIEPYLEEYFFDQPERAKTLRWKAVKSQIWPAQATGQA